MIEAVRATSHRQIFDCDHLNEASILVYEADESQMIPAMEAAERKHDKLNAVSLPSMGPNATRRHVDLSVRGDPDQVAGAFEEMKAWVASMGFS